MLLITPTEIGFKLLQEYTVCGVTVPDGYETNGADIPRMFWSIVPPFKPKYLPAIVIHDYLCSKKDYAKADKYFEELLYSIEDTIITRLMVLFVKIYHRVRYQIPM